MPLANSPFAHLHNCIIIHFRFPKHDPAPQCPPKQAAVQHLKYQSRYTTTRPFPLKESNETSMGGAKPFVTREGEVSVRRRGETRRVETATWRRARRSLKPNGKAMFQIAQRAICPADGFVVAPVGAIINRFAPVGSQKPVRQRPTARRTFSIVGAAAARARAAPAFRMSSSESGSFASSSRRALNGSKRRWYAARSSFFALP